MNLKNLIKNLFFRKPYFNIPLEKQEVVINIYQHKLTGEIIASSLSVNNFKISEEYYLIETFTMEFFRALKP